MNVAGRSERIAISLPAEYKLEAIPNTVTLSQMLSDGELDGIITARAPNCFVQGHPKVARLFPDFRAAEEAYFRKTRLFPIMHLLAVRQSLVEEHRWLAASIVKAFYHAKRLAMEELHDVGTLYTMLPWLSDDLKRAQAVMGYDVWPYGVPDNRAEIDAMFRYSVEQGLASRMITLEEYFAPGTLHRFQDKD